MPRNGRSGDTYRGTLQVYAAEVPRLARMSPTVSSLCLIRSERGKVQSIGPRPASIVRQRRGARLSCRTASFASFRFRVKLAQPPGSFHLAFYAYMPAIILFPPFLSVRWHIVLGKLQIGWDAEGTLGMTNRPHAHHRKEAQASKEEALIECSELHSKCFSSCLQLVC